MKLISTKLTNTLLGHIEEGKDINLVLSKTKIFLEDKGLSNYYPIILSKLEKKLEVKRNFETTQISTAFDLNKETVSGLIVKYTDGVAPYNVTVDKNLLGGFVLTQKGVVVDGSIKTLLRKFTQK